MSKLQPVNHNVYNQQSTSLALASTSQEDTAKAQSTSRAMLGGDNQRNAALPIQLRLKRKFSIATGEAKHLIPQAKRCKSVAPSTQRVVQPQVFGFEGNKHECRPVTQISCASTKRVTYLSLVSPAPGGQTKPTPTQFFPSHDNFASLFFCLKQMLDDVCR